jgi:UDP-N-acetylglucosamine--N-acetylmuramyl-(pentapeptide) pyrophosphoryl-undecaprenol N-acetylglucosamine transferase
VCLAGSGGGHVRQLVDLEPAVAGYDHFFVTEDSGFTRDLAGRARVRLVTHVALGQGRLGSPLRMIASAVRNFFQSAAIILSERPDVVITTGAGSVYFAVLWARLIGARVILIESFARFERLSKFACIAGPLAHHKVLQSTRLASAWPDAKVFDPMRVLATPPPPKKPLLFVTVGATLAFDRLVEGVARLKARGAIAEDVIIQTGVGGARPEGLETYETLPFKRMQAILRDADIVVCHGGTGSLITALREGCRVVAMPRRFDDGDHYDDHQGEITRAFTERGLIEVAQSEEALPAALAAVRAREPVVATSEPAELIAYLQGLLARGR